MAGRYPRTPSDGGKRSGSVFAGKPSAGRRGGNTVSGPDKEVKPMNRFSRYAEPRATPRQGQDEARGVRSSKPPQNKQIAAKQQRNNTQHKTKTSPNNCPTGQQRNSTALAVRQKPGGMLAPKGYTARPIIPASKAELLPVARAMNREDFAPRLKKLFDPEREAALEAIESGIYIGWRCPEFKHDCIRVGKDSKCFCGHTLSKHARYHSNSVHVPCAAKENGCECKAFAFVPSRAEEVGEWWLPRRRTFDAAAWRAKCKCKHTHEEHAPNGARRCRACASCVTFLSAFLCCACDRHWEDHVTIFESAEDRRQGGIPYGQHYLPFHELPELRNVVLTGREDDNSFYDELAQGPHAIPESKPSGLALQLRKNSEKKPW